MLKLELESEIEGTDMNTKATLDIHGDKIIVVREVACAISDLIKYSAKLGEEEHMYVMLEIDKTIAELVNDEERKINGQ